MLCHLSFHIFDMGSQYLLQLRSKIYVKEYHPYVGYCGALPKGEGLTITG